MSLTSLISGQQMFYYPPDGQDENSAALKYGSQTTIKGRLGEGSRRFDGQESQDQLADASLTTFSNLAKNGKITYDGQSYIIVDKGTIRRGNSDVVLHYNYLLKSSDNT
jgi:hypothetical protein